MRPLYRKEFLLLRLLASKLIFRRLLFMRVEELLRMINQERSADAMAVSSYISLQDKSPM